MRRMRKRPPYPVGSRPNERFPGGVDPAGSIGLLRGPNLFTDPLCETGADWTGITGTISVSAADPYVGSGAVRLTSTSANGRAYATLMAIGQTYRLTGVYRGNGTVFPRFFCVGASPADILCDGTTSTSWQQCDVTFVSGDTVLRVYAVGATANWIEIDDLYLSLES